MKFLATSGGLPVSERLATEVLTLPIHPYLSESEQGRIIDAVRNSCVKKTSVSDAWLLGINRADRLDIAM